MMKPTKQLRAIKFAIYFALLLGFTGVTQTFSSGQPFDQEFLLVLILAMTVGGAMMYFLHLIHPDND